MMGLAEIIGRTWQCQKERCYWYEGGNGCSACRSPKHVWTDEDDAEWLAEHGPVDEFSLKNLLPPFKPGRHCDFRRLKDGEEPYYMVM